jgi:two-component system response regulator NreC
MRTMALTTSQRLTPREREILGLLANGYTNREAAVELDISVRTVETHRASILAKLRVRTRADLVRYARRTHMLA